MSPLGQRRAPWFTRSGDRAPPSDTDRAGRTSDTPASVGHAAAMTIKGLTHISLSVTDLDRSLTFSRDVLRLPVFAERFEGTAFDGEEVMLLAGRTALCSAPGWIVPGAIRPNDGVSKGFRADAATRPRARRVPSSTIATKCSTDRFK